MTLLIFGIDGGNFEIINPLVARGELPNLAHLMRSGIRGTLRSTLPPQSAPAWVSLVTGQNPGRHGVFDFWARDLRQYSDASSQLNQSHTFAGKTIWDYAGIANLHVGVVSVPITYPAWPVNGFLISGTLLAPGVNQRAAYPPQLAERYGLELNFPDAYRYGASREEVMREGPAMMLRQRDAVLELLREYPCDVLMVVMGETDKAQHDFWRYLEDDCPPEERDLYAEVIYEHYRTADQILGDILKALGQDTTVAVVSDHGGGPYPRYAFRTNAWLRQQGLLVTRRRSNILHTRLRTAFRTVKRFLPGRLQATLQQGKLLSKLRSSYTGLHDLEWQATRAYRVPMQPPVEGIMINLEGRQPEGIVPLAEYESTIKEITAGLKALTNPETGQPVVSEIHHRDQIYSGDYVKERAPDLVLVLSKGYKGEWGNDLPVIAPIPAAERLQYRGAHTMNGVFVLSGPGIRQGEHLENISIIDVAPTLLHVLELPIPTDMDGHVLVNAFEPNHARVVRHIEPAASIPSTGLSLSEKEEKEIVERLQGLGYLE